ncbi:MAG TPA: NRDE family protein [Verrucomicrobiae bacterium]|nr:NRDE family protein [Verrucomicrobiae bacterium]
MCLIGISWRAHTRHELVLAANRDEFHARPTLAAARWKDHPDVYGGRDGSHHGSWLAVSVRKRVAAITNVRRMVPSDPQAPSRGKLVSEFLIGEQSAADYAQALTEDSSNYSGYNLLLYDGAELLFVTNNPEFKVVPVPPGVHTVSNASLDTPWPKARRLQTAMESWSKDNWESFPPLLKALGDRTPAPPAELPSTGIGPSMEKLLSPPFIVSPHYGTRCSTIVAVSAGHIDFTEHRYDSSGVTTGHTEQKVPLR